MEQKLVKPASLLSLIEADLPAQPYWIDPILPKGGTLLFGGEAKVGKSFILLELARALATGKNPFGCKEMTVPGGPTRVLLCEQEVGMWGLQKRVKTLFEPENKHVYGDKIFYVSKVKDLQLDTREGRKLLDDLVDEVQPQVLILDPIGRMNSYDENKSDQVQQLLNGLEALIDDYTATGMSIVFAHHFAKPSGDPKNVRDPLDPYNFRGSSKWKDNPDSLVTVRKLAMLSDDPKSWHIQMRFETRQDEGLADMLLAFNRDADLRVKFEKYLKVTTKTSKPALKQMPPKAPQERFRFAEG